MGNGNATQSSGGSSQASSSFGDPNKAFVDSITTWAMEKKIPLTLESHPYRLWTWKQGAFGHESIVIEAVNEDGVPENKRFGAFTIELCIAIETQTVFVKTQCIPHKVAEKHNIKDCQYYISNGKWKSVGMGKLELMIQAVQKLKQYIVKPNSTALHYEPDIVIDTLSQNFMDMALSLIKHHGSYSSYCNNCQTFVGGYLGLLGKRFNANTKHRLGSDGEAVIFFMGYMFFAVPGLVSLAVNSSVRRCHGNMYSDLYNKIEITQDQSEKIQQLMEDGMTQEMAVSLLSQNEWQLEKAKQNKLEEANADA